MSKKTNRNKKVQDELREMMGNSSQRIKVYKDILKRERNKDNFKVDLGGGEVFDWKRHIRDSLNSEVKYFKYLQAEYSFEKEHVGATLDKVMQASKNLCQSTTQN